MSELRRNPSLISVVVPVYNEESALSGFIHEIEAHLDTEEFEYELVFVNDGSRDGTLHRLLELSKTDSSIKIVDLTRNFGKEAAMTAGLDHAKGDAVIVIDVDLQEPPSLIPQMIRYWCDGYDVVHGRRSSRGNDTFLKRLTAGGFYKWFNRLSSAKIPEDVGDFRLMDRKVVDALRQLPERVRFMKGLYAWVGFRSIAVEFERQERRLGSTKFNYWRLWNFALDGITSFSTVPLRIWTYFGSAIALFAFLYGALVVGRTLLLGVDVPGYASILTAVLFLGGVQLIGLGILGEYIGRVYVEVKHRPIYLTAGVYGGKDHTGRDKEEDTEVEDR